MTEPVPQGGYEVQTAPAGAGRRGRGNTYDWEEIVKWARAHPGHKYVYRNVPNGSIGDLRKKYPDCRFPTYDRRQLLSGPGMTRQTVVDVVVTCELGAGDETAHTGD